MTHQRHFLIVILLLLLSSCVQQTPRKSAQLMGDHWPQHQAQVQAISAWQTTGKLGVKTPTDGGSATLRWKQHNSEYQIDFNGPFGQGNMSIAGTPKQVTFNGGGNPPQSAKTAEELLLKNTGWNIPLTQLNYWVRGLPDPNTDITHITPNTQGLIGELEQMGWKITYGDYLKIPYASDAIAMPGRMIAEYQEIRLTLLIREWKLGVAP